ncbi:MAG: HlyC/CorC family transporter [Rhodocyclaceae bacterium]|nr:HlyC/CorC family transporter [Rhodocyclaceae bacterium]MBX3668338.1 HlyC/CorC family transporter [Rhodocyclaceae bacterium]
MENFLLLLLALLLVALNGFFVAAEFGLVKLRQTRVKSMAKSYGWLGRIVARVHGQLDAYLSACQLGITLASLGLGWIGEPAFAGLLEPLLARVGIVSAETVHGIAFFVAFATISFLHIVAGELAPKSLALRMPERVAVWCAVPLYGFYWAMYPAIWLLNASALLVLRVFGLSGASAHDAQYSREELKLILRSSRPDHGFTADEWNAFTSMLDFNDLTVGDLMRPFKEAALLSAENSVDRNLDLIGEQRYSRYPYLDAKGKVVGIIHLKDLFLAWTNDKPLTDLTPFLRPVEIVPAKLPAMELFRRLRRGAPHFAVVVNKLGRPVGFLTLDNLLGALVGEIRDEFRPTGRDWLRMDDGTLMGPASLPIFSLERALGVKIDEQEVESVGGLVLQKTGSVPKEGECIEFDGFDIVVKKMQGPRILLVRVYPKARTGEHPDEGA